MAFYGKSRYNTYRKRSYNLSDNERRRYAQEMQDLEAYLQTTEFQYSSTLDSIYKNYDNYTIRLSNHSADNQYHDLHNDKLLVNVKCSKLNYKKEIEIRLPLIINKLETLDLEEFRFINIVSNNINCYYKNYKTKKIVYSL